jgi:hypothetical protein
MRIETNLGLKIAWLDNHEELALAKNENCDVAQLIGEYPELGFIRPEKIVWRANLAKNDNLLILIKSLKLRKNIGEWISKLSEHNLQIIIETPLSEESFLKWHEIFKEQMGKKDNANLHLNENWLKDKNSNNKKTFGVFLYRSKTILREDYKPEDSKMDSLRMTDNSELMGGNIGVLGNDILLIGYGVVKNVPDLKWNMGALLDFSTINFAQGLGYEVVSFGKDNNLYGWYLSPGLFSYKARLGLTPEADPKSPLITTIFLSYNNLKDPVIFLQKKNENFVTTIISNRDDINKKEYELKGISDIELLPQKIS